MSFSENTSDSDWKQAKMKVIKAIKREEELHHNSNNSTGGKIKYSQKFCDKWLNIFDPWLTRHSEDPNKPFCRACQCVLDCNRCHLQRHEHTTKHKRNLDILQSKGEVAARQNLCIRQERSKYYLQRKRAMLDSTDSNSKRQDTYDEGHGHFEKDVLDDDVRNPSPKDDDYHQHKRIDNIEEEKEPEPDPPLKNKVISKVDAQQEHSKKTNVIPKEIIRTSNIQKTNAVVKKKGLKLLMQIHKDKNALMDSFKEFIAAGGQTKQQNPPPKEKNHVDLFFESVSSSVKCLSPKLIAEAKMRVSQLICELELRELTETDNISGNSNSTVAPSTVVVAAPNSNNNTSYIVNQTHPHPPQTHLQQHFESLS